MYNRPLKVRLLRALGVILINIPGAILVLAISRKLDQQ